MKLKYEKVAKEYLKPQKKEVINNFKPFNYGFAILKSILAFLVVIVHQFKRYSTKNKLILIITKNRLFYVPCFFIMSFYFMCNTLLSLNPKRIYIRIIRLLIPYIGWPLITFVINQIFNKLFKTKLCENYDILKLQLLVGSGLMDQFWFMWDLISCTIIFVIILFIFRKHYLFAFHIILFLCYVSQYSGYYYNKYKNKKELYKKYTIGRMYEIMPHAVIGLTLKYYNIINILQNIKIKAFIFSLLIYNFIDDYNIFSLVRGFGYSGIYLSVKSICVIFIFSLFPSDKINNKYIKKVLILITKYSGGIYYLHISIMSYFDNLIDEFKKRSFFAVVINYLICYFICFLGNLIFGKTPLKYLFI
jgi:hypothetical protein